ncbi:MAG: hypothetical protein RIR26_550 [Pseudomonadota bacterium]|jgi:hypothetical protein
MKLLTTKTALLTFLCSVVAACGAPLPSSETASATPLQLSSNDIIDEEITNTISEQMILKCDLLFPESVTEKKDCAKAAAAMAAQLDFNFVRRSDGQSAFVFMHRRLKKLLDNQSTSTFLAALQTASEDALYAGKQFNLWSLALQHSNGSATAATEKLAVLIQDGAETAAQVKYLLIAQHPQALNLAQTLQVLEEALKAKKATAYPENTDITRTALYHYYVPRFLSQQLRQSGIRPDMAARLPFLFNSVYELHQIQKTQQPDKEPNHHDVQVPRDASPSEKRLVEKWNAYDTLYSDLLDHLNAPLTPFRADDEKNNVEDLYLGYAGALAGSRVSGRAAPLPAAAFAASFSADPLSFIKQNP